MDIIKKIEMVFETLLLKDLFKALEGSNITIKLTTLEKIENILKAA